MSWFLVLMIFGYLPPVLLHTIGFILLYKADSQLQNQKIVTMNLAVAEALHCLIKSIYNVLLRSGILPLCLCPSMFFSMFLNTATLLNIRLVYLHIIFDRFLDIWLNINYPIYINKKRLIMIIISIWGMSVCISGTLILLLYFKSIKHQTILLAIYFPLDLFIIVIAVSTCLYLFAKVKGAKQQTHVKENINSSRQRICLKMKIPSLMVLTFIIFNTSTTMVKYYLYFAKIRVVATHILIVIHILKICGYSSDAIIYVMLQRRVRTLLASFLRKRKDRIQVEKAHINLANMSV